MRLVLCGVRGSTPAPGLDYVRYGGNTSCVAVAHPGEPPRLLLDGGTGLSRVSSLLDGAAFEGTILLSHLHWDHTHGLPFFPAADRPDSSVTLLLPEQPGQPQDLLATVLSPPHFPIRPCELGGRWRFRALAEGDHDIEGFTVTAREIPHKGGRTFGFRVSDGASTVAYLPDHSPLVLGAGPHGLGEYHEAAVALARDADVLLHDGQHTAAELPAVVHLGHSAVEYAIGLARAAGAARLVPFHHDPARTDADIDRIVAAHEHCGVKVEAAAETTVIEVRQ